MANNSSLGIYIDQGLIKYAKLQKDKDNVKIEAFNVVFYDNLEREINKIITETGSTKIPICVNLSNEMYNYFEVMALMSTKDKAKSVKMDFETLCNEKGMSVSEFETRSLIVPIGDNPDKLVAIHISVDKNELSNISNIFAGKRVQSITSVSTSIANLLDIDVLKNENVVIVNLEKKATVTTVINSIINRVDTLSVGMKDILDAINETENSERKSYEVCKNTTIYTNGMDEANPDENEHLEEIMPILYRIVQETRNIIDSFEESIQRIYITGLGSIINNIDLYFQEYALNAKCEILKPFFLENTSLNTSFKDYIEVNSAIALALEGIGCQLVPEELKFKKGGSINIDAKSLLSNSPNINMDFKGPLDASEKVMLRILVICVIAILSYFLITNGIINRIADMKNDAQIKINSVTAEINKANADVQSVQAQADHYAQIAELLKNLEEQNEELENAIPDIQPRSIPNLLKSISNVVPKDVKLLSIKNTTEKHIVIEVVAPDYEQIGYFKALISTNSILTNVKSSSGENVSGYGTSQADGADWVYVTIEGDLQ